MKKYVFKDASWLEYDYPSDGNEHRVELWNCIKGDIHYSNDTAEDCYIAALYAEGHLNIRSGQSDWDNIYEMSIDELKQLCEDNGIEVVFVNEEDLIS